MDSETPDIPAQIRSIEQQVRALHKALTPDALASLVKAGMDPVDAADLVQRTSEYLGALRVFVRITKEKGNA